MMDVTAAEFQKKFGYYRQAAQREPIAVTSHGQPSVVLVSAEEYKRLKAHDRRTGYAWEMDDEELAATLEAQPPTEAEAFNHEYHGEKA